VADGVRAQIGIICDSIDVTGGEEMEKLNAKAAAMAGALTGAVLHGVGGLLLWGAPGMMTGVMRNMMYYQAPDTMWLFSWNAWIFGIIGGLVIGAVIGYLIAVFYNWGLQK